MVECLLDRILGNFVEDDAANGDSRPEDLRQMPADGLALAIGVGGQQDLRRFLERRLQMRDLFLLAAGNDVVRLELLVDIYTKATPVLVLDLLGNLRGRFGQIADVAIARFDTVLRAKKPAEGLRLRRRLKASQP